MALKTTKENIMGAINSLGYQVFKNGNFHWCSKNTPDMKINEDGSIHCWTSSPFNNGKSNHGDLIDFIMITQTNFKTAKEEAYRLVNLPIPSIDSYEDNGITLSNGEKKKVF